MHRLIFCLPEINLSENTFSFIWIWKKARVNIIPNEKENSVTIWGPVEQKLCRRKRIIWFIFYQKNIQISTKLFFQEIEIYSLSNLCLTELWWDDSNFFCLSSLRLSLQYLFSLSMFPLQELVVSDEFLKLRSARLFYSLKIV